MSDVAKDAHGRLFDNFTRQASHHHGGSYYDSGFSLQEHQDAHGKLHDLFGVPKDSSAHGEHYDEFGWKAMPAIHGQHFDSDFQQPTAHTSGKHGTWFDEFRGGTEVRYMVEGADYEGTIIECSREYASVRSRDGQTHEVGLSQFLSYRTPNEHQASPSIPASDAEAPSAHNATAHGNFGTTGEPALTTEPSVTEHVSAGPGNPDARSGTPAGLFDTFTRVKSLADRFEHDDVEKALSDAPTSLSRGPARGATHACKNCGAPYVKRAAQFHRIKNGIADKIGTSATIGSCSNCGKPAHDSIVAKSVDATETATQAQDLEGDKHVWCPHCKHECKKPTNEGTCPTCGTKVAVGKSIPPISSSTGDLGIEVPEREHKSTDHHSSQRKPGRCPHCGAALDELEHQTEQGQPDRAHKCIGTGIDVLKALVTA